jgi:hypothetical protein
LLAVFAVFAVPAFEDSVKFLVAGCFENSYRVFLPRMAPALFAEVWGAENVGAGPVFMVKYVEFGVDFVALLAGEDDSEPVFALQFLESRG